MAQLPTGENNVSSYPASYPEYAEMAVCDRRDGDRRRNPDRRTSDRRSIQVNWVRATGLDKRDADRRATDRRRDDRRTGRIDPQMLGYFTA